MLKQPLPKRIYRGLKVFRNTSVEDNKMNYCRHLKTITFLTSFLIIFPILALAGQYKVVRVVDGDTIVIRYNGKYEKVRLLCVNTPESVHPDKKQNIPMGQVASKYTQKKLTGKYVKLEFESYQRGNYNKQECQKMNNFREPNHGHYQSVLTYT